MKPSLPLLLILLAGTAALPAAPRPRPVSWAEPIIDSSLENAYRVSPDLYRSEQPRLRDSADLKALGVKSLLNLRRHHADPAELGAAGFTLLAEPMDAGAITEDLLVAALRQYRDAAKPVLVHCWHGSDRTGAFVAAYRMVFQGWNREAAVDEFRHGGYGFHEHWYPNLLELLGGLEVAALRAKVMDGARAGTPVAPTAAPAAP